MGAARGVRILAATALAAALLGGAPALAAGVVSTGHSGWAWSNPAPQGENLSDIAFTGGTGYAVGGFGTLLRSTDAGTSWAGLPSNTVQDLTLVRAVGASGFVTSGGCAVRRSTDTGTTLSPIDVGGGDTGCGTAVQAVSFSDASNGLILFQTGVVLATGDGGITLSRRTPVPGAATDLVAVSSTTAFATSNNQIYRSADSGGSWTLVANAPRILRSLVFATATVGYAAGDGGTVLKTIDGGASWVPAVSPPGAPDLSRVRCADANLCLITTPGGTIIRSADGGATYSLVTASASPIRAIAFASLTRVVAVGDGGVTVLSDDGGVTWRTTSTAISGATNRIRAGAAGFGYAVGPTGISLSADGGETWRSVGIPTPRAIQVAAFANPSTGFVQDDGGTLRRTINGGTSWQILDPGLASGPLQEIVPLGGKRLLLVTASGVGRSTDNGDSIALVDSPVLTRSRVIRRGILSAGGSGLRAFIVGRAGMLTSINGGKTWTQARLPRVAGRPPTIARADCTAPATCWILTTGSRLYRTTTLGARWIGVTAAVGLPLRTVVGIASGGPREAFLALASAPSVVQGLVLHTADGGTTWTPELVGRNPITSIDAGGGRGWGLAGLGQVFTTATGGRTATPSVLTITASARAIRTPGPITITGRLRGAQGGEQVTLYATGTAPRVLTVASSGAFTATFRLKKPTTFVAQWSGDGVRSGDGSPALVVRSLV